MSLQEFAAWWNDIKDDPPVATKLSTIIDWKGDIEKLCTNSGDCSTQMQQQVNTLLTKITTAHSAATKSLRTNK